jgi:D-tyrosyl-tRNA(Tyr) deacylase
VASAEVTVNSIVVARMQRGLLALVGVAVGDRPQDADELARKLVGLRVFPDEVGRMERSLLEVQGTLGVVSQFTLLANARKGRRPNYVAAAPPEQARPLVERVATQAEALGVSVATGRFGANMQVHLINEGPVTLLLDTRDAF